MILFLFAEKVQEQDYVIKSPTDSFFKVDPFMGRRKGHNSQS